MARLYRKFGHQEILFAPLLYQLNTVIKLLSHISSLSTYKYKQFMEISKNKLILF